MSLHPQAGSAANIGHRTSSSSEAGIRSWVGSMSAVWKNIGRAAAVGPTGNKDVPKEWDVSSTDTEALWV